MTIAINNFVFSVATNHHEKIDLTLLNPDKHKLSVLVSSLNLGNPTPGNKQGQEDDKKVRFESEILF